MRHALVNTGLRRQVAELVCQNAELRRGLAEIRTRQRIRHHRVGVDYVRRFWRDRKAMPKRPAPELELAETTLTNTPTGLGDCVVISDLPRAAARSGAAATASVYSTSRHWPDVVRLMSTPPAHEHPRMVSLSAAVAHWDLGAGHMIQRARTLFRLPVDPVPRGDIVMPAVRRIRNRVALHFEAGCHAQWQREHIHPRARQVYPRNLVIIRDFIRDHPDWSFVEFGERPSIRDESVEQARGLSLIESVRLMAECQYYLGIISGPMHLAVGLGLQAIAIVNFPDPGQLCLPQLLDTGVVEGEWLYPQQVVLHQDADSPHWPQFSARALSRAFDGDVYPYWGTETTAALRPC